MISSMFRFEVITWTKITQISQIARLFNFVSSRFSPPYYQLMKIVFLAQDALDYLTDTNVRWDEIFYESLLL